MKFTIIKLRWLTVGLNFKSEEQQTKIISLIRSVWNYYPGDFQIIFSGNGQIDYIMNVKDIQNKFVDLEEFIVYIDSLIELKEGCLPAGERSKQLYEEMIRLTPLKKFIFKQEITNIEEKMKIDRNFIENLKFLKHELEII